MGLLDRFDPGEEPRSAQRKPYVFGMPKGGEGLISILQTQVRKAGHANEHGRDRHSTIIGPQSDGHLRSTTASFAPLTKQAPTGFRLT